MVRRAAVLLFLAGCAHGPGSRRREWQPIELPRITEPDDIAISLDEHAAVPVGHPQRAASRAGLRGWLLSDLEAQLGHDHTETAFERFVAALQLYDAEELAHPPADPALLAAARRIGPMFARRGAEREVLTTLATRITFAPDDRRARFEYETLCAWIDEVEVIAKGPLARSQRLIELHEEILRDLPCPFLRERLERLYLALHAALGRSLRHGLPPRGMLAAQPTLARLGYLLGALHVRAGTLDTARAAVGKVRGQPGDDPDLRRLLDAATRRANPVTFVALAHYFAPMDAEAAERACAQGIATLGADPDLLACTADYAARRGHIALALSLARAALALRGDTPPLREQVARLMLARVAGLVNRERIAEAAREVAAAERFFAETHRRLPSLDLEPSLGTFRYVLGRGNYMAGNVADAEKLLERALEAGAPPEAYQQLGVIKWRRGRYDDALRLYALAAEGAVQRPDMALELAARLRGRMGDALFGKGSQAMATDAWRDSLRLWGEYIKGGAPDLGADRMEAIAAAEVERARLLVRLGEGAEAVRAIQKAIDAAPERGDTYVESVALLATEGFVPEATDVLHRALGQPAVLEYHKVYCSLWIYDLGRRVSGRPDPQAQHYLENVDGNLWYHRLARFMAGRIPYREMERQADTPGKKAELFFYEAQNRLFAGQVDEARLLWKQVLQTDMMAFFEYDMALHYLGASAR
jgi:tetratricopeptide (TPR) repeat protein